MYQKITNISDDGEFINEKIREFKLWDEDKGLLWRSKNLNTKMFHDIKLSDFVTNKQEYANIHLLSENIYKQTNAIMVRVSKTKVRFANINDMSKIINLCEDSTKRFINKMIKHEIIAKRIDKIGGRSETKYLLNPIFFFSSKYLSPDLYFSFKHILSKYLTPWQVKLFEEYGNLKGEIIINKE